MSSSATGGVPAIDSPVAVDLNHLQSFTEGDTALESELAELFLTSARRYLRLMKEAVEQQRSWSAEAHALKGASANLGARRVASLAGEAEFTPPNATVLQTLQAAVADVETFFAARRP